MDDHVHSTAVPRRETWEDQPVFREVFLAFLPPEDAASCRRLGDLFFTVLLEAHMQQVPADAVLLAAIAADVRCGALVLAGTMEDFDELPGLPAGALGNWRDRLLAIETSIRTATEVDA